MGLSLLFIHARPRADHRTIADGVLVMTGGRIVEQGAVDTVLGAPTADYTRRLLRNTPSNSKSPSPRSGPDRVMIPTAPPLRRTPNAGQVALVTGGGTGIGRATALELAGSGARVAICGAAAEPLEQVAEQVRSAGGEALAVTADLREPDDVARMVDATRERFGAASTCSSTTPAASSPRRPRRSPTTAGARSSARPVDAVWSVTRTVRDAGDDPGRRRADRVRRLQPAAAGSRASRTRPRARRGGDLASGLALEWSPPPHPHGLPWRRDDRDEALGGYDRRPSRAGAARSRSAARNARRGGGPSSRSWPRPAART